MCFLPSQGLSQQGSFLGNRSVIDAQTLAELRAAQDKPVQNIATEARHKTPSVIQPQAQSQKGVPPNSKQDEELMADFFRELEGM